jgi:hypothetical protein
LVSVLGDAVSVGRRFDGVRGGLTGDDRRPALATDYKDRGASAFKRT